MGAVHIIVSYFACIVDKVPTVQVIYISISIVIIAFFTFRLSRICPNIVF